MPVSSQLLFLGELVTHGITLQVQYLAFRTSQVICKPEATSSTRHVTDNLQSSRQTET